MDGLVETVHYNLVFFLDWTSTILIHLRFFSLILILIHSIVSSWDFLIIL